MAPRLQHLTVGSMFLEIPLLDFELLPAQLGCSLLRGQDCLTLAPERPGCSLLFTVEDERAHLSHLSLHDDEDGRFMREVVGALFVAYQGELEATLAWSDGVVQPPLSIRGGETEHPLLSGTLDPVEVPGPASISLALLEQWLADARQEWGLYQQQKAQRPHTPSR
jgi:hypothetical protein